MRGHCEVTHLMVPKVASEGCSTTPEMDSARRAGIVPQERNRSFSVRKEKIGFSNSRFCLWCALFAEAQRRSMPLMIGLGDGRSPRQRGLSNCSDVVRTLRR